MTKEREEAIRRECEAAACVKYPDPIAEVMDFLNHNGLTYEEGARTGLLRTGYAEGMFRERLRAEELVEAAYRVIYDLCGEQRDIEEIATGLNVDQWAARRLVELDAAITNYRKSRIEEATKPTEP